MIFDIDGVVATMVKWEHLLGDTFDFRRWRDFEKHYIHAALISRGARLVDFAVDSNVQVVWSTTRPSTAAAATWEWLKTHQLPTGPIMTRHRIKDGTRPAVEVKLRHWYQWIDRYGDTNPVVAWVDDDDAALSALPWNGAPAWHPLHLQRTLRRHEGEPLLQTLAEQVHPSQKVLAENLAAHRAAWDARDSAFQRKRSVWWEQEQARMRRYREQQRRRQESRRRRD